MYGSCFSSLFQMLRPQNYTTAIFSLQKFKVNVQIIAII